MKLEKLVLIVVASGVLAACGGGGGGEGTAPAPEKAAAPKPAEAAPVSNYKGGPVTDGGTVSGSVTYAGTETDGTLTITKDHESCDLSGQPTQPANTLVVNGGKLKHVIVWIDGITAGKPFTPANATIDNHNCRFEPHVVIGNVGAQVIAKNSDPVLHNTNLSFKESGKPIANVALPTQGQEIGKDLRKPGLVDISCDAHEWMKAYMLVTEHPYAAVTGDDGTFSFTDVPAGAYTLKFWHERLGEKSQPVTVAAAGTATADQAF